VAAYPWSVFSDGSIKKGSIDRHLYHIISEIKGRISHFNVTEALDIRTTRHKMILTYWTIYVQRAAVLSDIHNAVNFFGVNLSLDAVRRFLYCMRVAGWIGEQKYGHPSFYYPIYDVDPFEYSFIPGAKTRDQIRWKRDVVAAQRAEAAPPKPVTDLIGLVGA
jgi:hypothetical protein